MHNDYGNETRKEVDLVDFLARLPLRSLETKVSTVRASLAKRHQLSQDILSDISQRQINLEDKKWRLRYAQLLDPLSAGLHQVERQLTDLEEERHRELLSCLHTSIELQERLEELQSQFEKARAKLHLIQS